MDPNSYQMKLTLGKNIYILLATMFPVVNLLVILTDSFKNGLSYGLTQAAAVVILISASSQIVSFTTVGSLVIRKLQVYFKKRYEKQRRSIIKALVLILSSLIILNMRYGL